MSEEHKEFMKELENKVRNLGGPIIDVLHNNVTYHKVETLVNFLLDYFYNKKEAEKP